MLESNNLELLNICKTKDEFIKKLKLDIEKLNETNMILSKRNKNLESELENYKSLNSKDNLSISNSNRSLNIDRIDSNSNSISLSNSECQSIEKNTKVISKLNRFEQNQNKSNKKNISEEYDECFDLELTNTFTANELKCKQNQNSSNSKPTQSSNRSINSGSTHSNSTQPLNNHNHNHNRVTKPNDLSSIPTEIDIEQEDNKEFEFNKTNDDIDKSSLISCASKDTKGINRFNNESVNV